MFEARFPGQCAKCRTAIVPGEQVKKDPRGYIHVVCVALQKPGSRPSAWTAVRLAAEANALELAVVAREVAEDDYFASEYRYATAMLGRRTADQVSGYQRGRTEQARERALQAMIDARMAAMLEADAVGLINLFDSPEYENEETRWLAIARIAQFAGSPDVDAALGNAFGAAEREQEAEVYLSNPV